MLHRLDITLNDKECTCNEYRSIWRKRQHSSTCISNQFVPDHASNKLFGLHRFLSLDSFDTLGPPALSWVVLRCSFLVHSLWGRQSRVPCMNGTDRKSIGGWRTPTVCHNICHLVSKAFHPRVYLALQHWLRLPSRRVPSGWAKVQALRLLSQRGPHWSQSRFYNLDKTWKRKWFLR